MAKVTGDISMSGTQRNPWDNSGHAWNVELRYRGRKMTTAFYTGSALGEPTIEDVMECLTSNAAGYENTGDFESWASEYGCNTDSRKAEATFRAVEQQTENLRRLLGDDFDQIVFDHVDS